MKIMRINEYLNDDIFEEAISSVICSLEDRSDESKMVTEIYSSQMSYAEVICKYGKLEFWIKNDDVEMYIHRDDVEHIECRVYKTLGGLKRGIKSQEDLIKGIA